MVNNGNAIDAASHKRSSQRLDLRVLNAETGVGIPRVQLDLFQNDRRIASAHSDSEGRAAFAQLSPGTYQISQASYPNQMTGISVKPIVRVGENGSLHLGGVGGAGGERVREVRMLNFPLRH